MSEYVFKKKEEQELAEKWNAAVSRILEYVGREIYPCKKCVYGGRNGGCVCVRPGCYYAKKGETKNG